MSYTARVPIHANKPPKNRNAPCTSIRLDTESDKYEVTSVIGVAPTWRDVWAIIRGRYQPLVRRRKVMTSAGANRVLKEVWADKKFEDQLNGPSFFDWPSEEGPL